MGSICTRGCDLWANDSLKTLVASCRRCRIERKYGNTQYLILCRLPVLVLREISKVDRGSIPERPPLATAVEKAYCSCIP